MTIRTPSADKKPILTKDANGHPKVKMVRRKQDIIKEPQNGIRIEEVEAVIEAAMSDKEVGEVHDATAAWVRRRHPVGQRISIGGNTGEIVGHTSHDHPTHPHSILMKHDKDGKHYLVHPHDSMLRHLKEGVEEIAEGGKHQPHHIRSSTYSTYKVGPGTVHHVKFVHRDGTHQTYQSTHLDHVKDYARGYNPYHKIDWSKPIKEEVALDESVQLHRVGVTVSDPDHPMVSKRKEELQKFIKVRASDKNEALDKAKDFYKNRGLHVHSAEHHSILKEDIQPIAELTQKTLKSYIEKGRADVERKHQEGSDAEKRGQHLASAVSHAKGNERASKIGDAVRKLKEDVEQIDEMSTRDMYSHPADRLKKWASDHHDPKVREAAKRELRKRELVQKEELSAEEQNELNEMIAEGRGKTPCKGCTKMCKNCDYPKNVKVSK